VVIFDFAKTKLVFNGVMLSFHLNDLKVLKKVRFYLKSYGFDIQIKWVVVNSLPFTNNEDPSLKVPAQS
jgi:hypothetical protein